MEITVVVYFGPFTNSPKKCGLACALNLSSQSVCYEQHSSKSPFFHITKQTLSSFRSRIPHRLMEEKVFRLLCKAKGSALPHNSFRKQI